MTFSILLVKLYMPVNLHGRCMLNVLKSFYQGLIFTDHFFFLFILLPAFSWVRYSVDAAVYQ